MINPRYAHCSIEVNDNLFVIGGRQYGGIETSILKDCEFYNFKAKKWTSIPPLSLLRS